MTNYFIRVKLIPNTIKPNYWDEVDFEEVMDGQFIGVYLYEEDLVHIPTHHYVGGGGIFSLKDLKLKYKVSSKDGKVIIDEAV